MSAAEKPHKRTIYGKYLADIMCWMWMDGSLILSYLTKAKESLGISDGGNQTLPDQRPKQVIRGPKNKPKKIVTIKQWTDLTEAELRIHLQKHKREHLQREEEKVFAKLEDQTAFTEVERVDV